jgi:hypothetical protein
VLDIEREQDIERLRQVARLQKSQLEHLIAALARKCAELEKLKGGSGELQMALKLLEEAQPRWNPSRRRSASRSAATVRRSRRTCRGCRWSASWTRLTARARSAAST